MLETQHTTEHFHGLTIRHSVYIICKKPWRKLYKGHDSSLRSQTFWGFVSWILSKFIRRGVPNTVKSHTKKGGLGFCS